jgi:hypothetical protein
MDRLETVKALQGGSEGGDDNLPEKNKYSLRGLEIFQSTESKAKYNAIRKVHRSTILIEQQRQALFGMKNPERFRLMVGPQSEQAARRAQRLAVMDAFDVYGRDCSNQSPCSAGANASGAIQARETGSEAWDPTKAQDERILQWQQANARRLIEIYSQPGYNPFRFPMWPGYGRDGAPLTGDKLSSTPGYTRFGIRRDSLSSLGVQGMV